MLQTLRTDNVTGCLIKAFWIGQWESMKRRSKRRRRQWNNRPWCNLRTSVREGKRIIIRRTTREQNKRPKKLWCKPLKTRYWASAWQWLLPNQNQNKTSRSNHRNRQVSWTHSTRMQIIWTSLQAVNKKSLNRKANQRLWSSNPRINPHLASRHWTRFIKV